RHVIGADAAGAIGHRIAGGQQIADRHLATALVSVAARGVVDLAPGHAADHGADRGGGITPGATAHLAAQHRTDHSATHRGPHASVLRAAVGGVAVVAPAVAIPVLAAVPTVGVIRVVAVLAGVTALARGTLAVPVVEHRVPPHHPRDVIA